jgi:hypothetical protein
VHLHAFAESPHSASVLQRFELLILQCVACLFRVQPALFVHLRSAGTWWINTALSSSTQLQAAYWAVGWLLGQALVNHCTVGLQLAPLLFYRLLLQAHDLLEVCSSSNAVQMA